jgi:hypothetical protein
MELGKLTMLTLPDTTCPNRPAATPAQVPGLVSVIIPVHDRLQYLAHAIESALRQTHSDVEVIVVDDGSPKDPAPVLSSFGDRVKLVRKSNGGLASARNFGIAHARGEYLSFLDDDDFLEATAFRDLLDTFGAYPAAAWAAGRYDYVDPSGTPLPRPPRSRYQSGDVYRAMIRSNLMGAPSVVLARARVIRALNGFDEAPGYHMAEDYDRRQRLARQPPMAATQRKVTNSPVQAPQHTHCRPPAFTRAVLAVLHKHRATAPTGCDEDFRRAIARVHLTFGDSLYMGGEVTEARAQWRLAAAGGVLSHGALRWRAAKSRLPLPVLQLLRTGRQHLRV